MKNKRPLAPPFIDQLDKYLLHNRPNTWSARAHLVFYYGLLFASVITAIFFLIPDDPREQSTIYLGTFLVAVLAGIGFIIWLIYLLRFNVFKRFGILSNGDRIKTFLLYFVSIGLMVFVIYIPAIVESIRANNAYGNEEIVKDINDINLTVCQLNYDSIPHKWKTDTFLIRKELEKKIAYDDEGDVVIIDHRNDFHEIHAADFELKKSEADSSIKLNDSLFVIYECPDYDFIKAYRSIYYANTKLLGSAAIYKILEKRQHFDTVKQNAILQMILKKYDPDPDFYHHDRDSYNYMDRITSKYGLSVVSNNFDHIIDRKYRWKGSSLKAAVTFFFYAVLIMALMVFIFRHTSMKTFFLSILSAIILLVVTALFIAFLNISEIGVFISGIIYFFIFLVLALTTSYSKVRKVVSGIGLNLTVFFVAFLPLVITGLYYDLLRKQDELKNTFNEPSLNSVKKYENESLHYLCAEVIGFVVLLVLIETVFKKLYRSWYALPEQ